MVSRYLPQSSQNNWRVAALSVMLKVVLAVFVAEAIVMGLLMGLPKLPDIVEVFFDATLLSILVAPAMYLLLYQPLYKEIFQRAQIEAELRNFQDILQQKAVELEEVVVKLQQTPELIQSEKMISLERLVAGIAHEINNPITFVHNNLAHVEDYAHDLIETVKLYQENYPDHSDKIQEWEELVDLSFVQKDLSRTIESIKNGTERVTEIVLALRDFSRLDEAESKIVDIHSGLDSTLLILQHRLQRPSGGLNIEVVRDYGTLPRLSCLPRQLNQVFLNLLSNSIDAIELAYAQEQYNQPTNRSIEKSADKPADKSANQGGCITIRTTVVDSQAIKIVILDNGAGIPAKFHKKIFDPFFTTKPVGQGTGIGLSISYQIVVAQHHGRLECRSKEGEGSEFVIHLPLK